LGRAELKTKLFSPLAVKPHGFSGREYLKRSRPLPVFVIVTTIVPVAPITTSPKSAEDMIVCAIGSAGHTMSAKTKKWTRSLNNGLWFCS
jgi:hypothetical protein